MADETVKEKPVITIDQLKEDLKNGVTRVGMQEKYGLRRADIGRIFKHPELKGLKVHTAGSKASGPRKSRLIVPFILQDASGNDITSTVIPTAPSEASTEVADQAPTTVEATAPVAEVAQESNW